MNPTPAHFYKTYPTETPNSPSHQGNPNVSPVTLPHYMLSILSLFVTSYPAEWGYN
jgi:hypothetical protein